MIHWDNINSERGPDLPIKPFRRVLSHWLTEAGDAQRLAEQLGVNPRQIYNWLHHYQFIGFKNADRVLSRDGRYHVGDLWPSYYDA